MHAENALADAGGGAAVERDRFQRGQAVDQRDQIVARVIADIAVETALATRLTVNDVPLHALEFAVEPVGIAIQRHFNRPE